MGAGRGPRPVVRVAAVLALLAAPAAAGGGEPPGLTAAQAMDAVMWGKVPIGGAFSLADHDGVPRTEADYRGKVVLIYFGFTFCPDICPADLMGIAGALNELGDRADQVQGLFVTLDPERDDQHLKDYVQAFHPDLVGLTGEPAVIRRTANDYSIYYRRIDGGAPDAYTIDHSAYTFMYDKEGNYRGFFPPGTTSDLIAKGLEPLLGE